jgi:hypothetical protein
MSYSERSHLEVGGLRVLLDVGSNSQGVLWRRENDEHAGFVRTYAGRIGMAARKAVAVSGQIGSPTSCARG